MLNEFRSTNITWDKATSRIYSPVTANASDENGRKLVVQIVNSGQVEDLTGATLHLYWETRDKAHDGLDVFKAVDLKKGEFELSYTTGMLSNQGVLNANLVLIDTVGRVVSERFKITVTEGIDNDAIQSENSFSSLTQALIDVSNLEQNYAPRLNDLTAQLQQTEQELSSQLAQKASKDELNALGELKFGGEYPTLSALQNAYPTGATGVYLVIADGFVYRWNGASWIQSVQFQSTGVADNSVSYSKQNFLTVDDTDTRSVKVKKEYTIEGLPYYQNWWIDYIKEGIVSATTTRSVIYEIPKNVQEIKIQTLGEHNRFVVALANDISLGSVATVLYKGVNGDGASVGNETYIATTNGYKYLVVGISTSGTKIPVTFTVREKEIEMATSDDVNKNQIKEKEDYAVYTKKQTLVDGYNHYVNKRFNFKNNFVYDDINPRSIAYEIPANSSIKIETIGSHNRFVVALVPDLEHLTKGLLLYAGENNDGISTGDETFNVENTGYKYLMVTLSTSGTKVPVHLTVDENLKLATTDFVNKMGTSSITGIGKTKEVYPVMFGVKMSNERDVSKGYSETPRPLGWLYYIPEAPYKIMYADGSPDNMKHIFNWDQSVTWNGISTPNQYRPFITKDGDVIFVWRGDLLGNGTGIANVRQNPIIYPAGDFDSPIEVDLGDEIKPSSWLQNCGADFIYNQDVFIFSEYTRPSHLYSYVWKVTKPFTDPNNWRKVKEFELSGSNLKGMKHAHTINYDTFSGTVYLTTGDDDTAAKVFASHDYGETWELVLEGQRRFARVLNFVFTKEKVYWANDDSTHGFYSIDRDVDGVPDFTNITTLYNLSGHPPTYVNCLIDEPNGILMLHRYDSTNAGPLIVHFWDIESATMHVVKEIYPTEDVTSEWGFRVEAANFYHSKGDGRIIVGFGSPQNKMDLLNNASFVQNVDKINNLSLEVVRTGDSFDLKVSAITDRS